MIDDNKDIHPDFSDPLRSPFVELTQWYLIRPLVSWDIIAPIQLKGSESWIAEVMLYAFNIPDYDKIIFLCDTEVCWAEDLSTAPRNM